jgi:hypothetical protein
MITTTAQNGRTLADLDDAYAGGPGVCDQLRSFRKPTSQRARSGCVDEER